MLNSLSSECSYSAVLLFGRYLLVHLAARAGFALFHNGRVLQVAMMVAMVLAVLLSFRSAFWRKVAFGGAAALVVAKYIAAFPVNSNHFHLEVLLVVLLSLVRLEDAEQRALLVGMVRALFAWVMLFSGLQKLAYGTYFQASFFATTVSQQRFGWVLRHLTSEEEFGRLTQLSQTDGAGPYLFESFPVLALSNAVYVSEIATGVMLLVPRLRRYGAYLALFVIVGIELVARELLFGLLACNMLAFYFSERVQRLSIGFSFIAYIVLFAFLSINSEPIRLFN